MAHPAERGKLEFQPRNPIKKIRTASDGGFRGGGEGPQNPLDRHPVLRLVKP